MGASGQESCGFAQYVSSSVFITLIDLNNMTTVCIEPGGYPQWGDAAIGTLRAVKTDPAQSTEYIEKTINQSAVAM